MTTPNGTPKTVVTSPDPSDRATASLMHEIEMIKERFGERFKAQEKAVELLQARADRMPSIDVVERDLQSLSKVMAEKFATIQIQFTDRDLALIAALAAAEKAVGVQNNNNLLANTKQEAAIDKRIDAMSATNAATAKGTDDKIDGMKERISIIERNAQGVESKSQGIDKSAYVLLAVVMAVIAVGGLVFEIATHHP